MAQHVKELIDKIKAEGVEAAQKKAAEIEQAAQKKADSIIAQAQENAHDIVSQAKKEAENIRQTTQVSLEQASRDMLLDLRVKIQSELNAIINNEVKDALTVENVGDIIAACIKSYLKKKSAEVDIKVAVSPRDLNKLKKGFIAKLQDKLKRDIEFQPSEEIGKGFTISFDGGKSCFDFTDLSLAEYLSNYLNPEIAALLQKAVVSPKKNKP